MPTHLSWPLRRAALIAFAAIAALFWIATAPIAARASVPVDLRVVDSSGEILADHTQYTDTVGLKTDTKATCFGQGTGGSGDRVKVPGSTALGAVVDGIAGDVDLKPVSVTDAFDFGLGVCGIGDAVAPDTGFWYLKQDGVATLTGGDQTKVKRGDAITWYLDPDFADAPPAELEIDAPQRAPVATPFEVRVFEHADDGTRTPAAGVEVTGASQPTDATGTTSVELTTGKAGLQAIRDGAISDAVGICVAKPVGDCPKEAGGIIGGSSTDDEITGSKGPDGIDGAGGDDRIDAEDGEADDVNCGGGKDKVIADREDETAKNCEKVRD